MQNNTDSKQKRPGLIRQPRVVPNNPNPEAGKHQVEKSKDEEIKKEVSTQKKSNINQQRNIKISTETKKQLDILLKFSNHKFAYELIDSMIDVYVEHALDHDQKRAFKTLTKILSD
ncbi:hypothetical protein [Metabacillus niabensis]|uniref:hypothetical protein n=1 Tax=Metabacillus niabensis TaxID=324854 RepID=UPI00399F5713